MVGFTPASSLENTIDLRESGHHDRTAAFRKMETRRPVCAEPDSCRQTGTSAGRLVAGLDPLLEGALWHALRRSDLGGGEDASTVLPRLTGPR
jgi:hypothetical protein